MRLAIVVPRYGAELLGGPEEQSRLIAERLAAHHQVEVLTTCAADIRTWSNVHPEGADRLRGVTVRRFATVRPGDPAALGRSADRVFFGRHRLEDEMDWLRAHGPWAPGLVEYLERQHALYDVVVFFTVLHAAAVLGIRAAPHKSLLVPGLHEGPELQLDVVQDACARVAAFAWQSEDERRLVSSRVHLRHLVEDVVGCGIDLPEGEVERDGDEGRLVGPPDREPLPPHLDGAGNAFRRRHRLYGPFVLQAGRIERGCGYEELLEYFQHYAREGGDARLVLMGSKLMWIPEDPGVRFGGVLPDEERPHSLEAATVVVIPSPDDSQILLALEALSVGTPVLVNARATSVVHHCQQSQAGLFYADRWEFTEALKLMVRDRQVHAALGRNGRAYVSDRYRWPTVLGKFERMFERLRMPGRGERAEPPEPAAATVAMSSRPAGSDRGRLRDRGHLRPRDRQRGRAHDRPRQRRRDRR